MALPRIVAATILALLLSLILSACREQEPLRIGFFGGLTGRAAGLGTSGRNGFLLAIEQANAAGEINARRIEPVVSDAHINQEAATTALRNLFELNVAAVIGPMTSQVAVTVMPEVTRARVPMISPTVSTNQLSGLDDYFLRVYYSNAQAAALLADYLVTHRDRPRMVALYDLGNRAYTEDWVNDFSGRYSQLGGELLAMIPFEIKSETLYTELADRILATNPEGILLLANGVDTAMIAQQLGKRGVKIPLFATGWSSTEDLLQLGGASVEGLTIIQSANLEDPGPICQAFRKAYIERYQEPPNFPAAHAYDATRLLLAALGQGPVSGERLKQALLNLPPQTGVQGTIAFDRNGDLRTPNLHLATIEAGRFHPLR